MVSSCSVGFSIAIYWCLEDLWCLEFVCEPNNYGPSCQACRSPLRAHNDCERCNSGYSLWQHPDGGNECTISSLEDSEPSLSPKYLNFKDCSNVLDRLKESLSDFQNCRPYECEASTESGTGCLKCLAQDKRTELDQSGQFHPRPPSIRIPLINNQILPRFGGMLFFGKENGVS